MSITQRVRDIFYNIKPDEFIHDFESSSKFAGGLREIRKSDPAWLLKRLKECKRIMGELWERLRKMELNNDEFDDIGYKILELQKIKRAITEVI